MFVDTQTVPRQYPNNITATHVVHKNRVTNSTKYQIYIFSTSILCQFRQDYITVLSTQSLRTPLRFGKTWM